MESCLGQCKNEFKCRNCGLNHFPAEEFIRSEWQYRSKSIYYLIYRWLIAIFFVTCVMVSMSHIASWYDFGMYFIFMTNWGIWTCLVAGTFGAVLVTLWYFDPKFSDGLQAVADMPVSFKMYWAFHCTAMTLSFVISIIYWGVLYKKDTPIYATNVLRHACNSATMLLDVIIVAHPVRLYHAYMSLAVGSVFLIFSIIYYLAGGKDTEGNAYIYFVLDWSKPKSALVTVVSVFLLAIVCQTALYAVYKLRVLLHDWCVRKSLVLPVTNEPKPTDPWSS